MQNAVMRRLEWSILLVVCFLFLAPFTVRAADYSAVLDDLGLYGGLIHDIDMDTVDPERVVGYVTANISNGFFRAEIPTTPGEPVIWIQSSSTEIGTVGDVATANDVAGLVFFNASTRLMVSTDYGETYDPVMDSDFSGASLAYRDGVLLATHGDNTVYVITDSGASYTAVEVVAETEDNVRRVSADADTGVFYALVEDGTVPDTVTPYISTDSGATWTSLGNTGNWKLIQGDKNTPGRVVLFGSDGILISTDHGANWTDISDSAITANATILNSIAFYNDGSSIDRIYIGGYQSDDNGASWEELATYAHSENGVGGDAWYTDTSLGIWTKCGLGPCVSDPANGGRDYVEHNEGFAAVRVDAIALDSSHEYAWLATDFGLAFTSGFEDSVLEGEDPEWTFPVEITSHTSAFTEVVVSPDDANDVIAFGQTNTFKTTDMGSTWTQGTLTGGDGTVTEAIVDDNGVLYVGLNSSAFHGETKNGGVYTSSDFGETWTDLSADYAVNGLAVDGEGNILAGGGSEGDSTQNGLWHYDGSTWETLDVGDTMGFTDSEEANYINDVEYLSDIEYWVVTTRGGIRGAVYVSQDLETWSNVTDEDPDVSDFSGLTIEADPDSEGGYYVASGFPGRQGAIFRCDITSCVLYSSLNMEQYVNDMVFDGLVFVHTNGVTSAFSQATVTLKRKKLKKKYRLTARIKDAITRENQNGEYAKFYRKTKNGKYKHFKKKKVKKGKAVLKVAKRKKMNHWQVRYRAKNKRGTYGLQVFKSKRVKVPKKKTKKKKKK